MKLSDAVQAYHKLKAKREEMKARHKDELATVVDKMSLIETAIMKFLNATGQTSAKTAYGTPYISKLTTVTVVDRDAFMEFIREGGNENFLASAANKEAVQEYMAEHKATPPGVKVTTKRKVNIPRGK